MSEAPRSPELNALELLAAMVAISLRPAFGTLDDEMGTLLVATVERTVAWCAHDPTFCQRAWREAGQPSDGWWEEEDDGA